MPVSSSEINVPRYVNQMAAGCLIRRVVKKIYNKNNSGQIANFCRARIKGW